MLRLAILEQIDDIRPSPALERIRVASEGMAGCELATCRAGYAVISEALVAAVGRSLSGDLDVALAYSRPADAHWLQSGPEMRSPYGDERQRCGEQHLQ